MKDSDVTLRVRDKASLEIAQVTKLKRLSRLGACKVWENMCKMVDFLNLEYVP